MARKKTDNKTGMLKGIVTAEQGKQVPRERWPDVAVIKNSDHAVKVKAFRLHLPRLLTIFTLKWGTQDTLLKKRERWATLWFSDNGDGTGTARMRATPDINEGSCLEPRENGDGLSFRYRAVETGFDFVSVSGKHKVEVRDCRVVDTGSGRELLVVFGLAAPIPVSVLARPYPRQPGKRCSAKGRKYNGRTKQVAVPKPKPVPKPVAAVAPPEQRTPPVSSWPKSSVATPAISTIPYAYGGLEKRLEAVENTVKTLKETVDALKGSGTAAGADVSELEQAVDNAVCRIEEAGESKCGAIGGAIKSTSRKWLRASLESRLRLAAAEHANVSAELALMAAEKKAEDDRKGKKQS